jgi:phage antirepressor YoqD-like protein
MLERNEHGKRLRQYFIDVENRAKQIAPALPKSFAEALRLAADQAEQIEQMKPKAEFYDTVVDTTDTFDFAEAAKMMNLGIGRNTLLAKLRGRNILNKDNVPYQRYISAGYFEVKQSKYTIGDKVKIHPQARFTQKGIKWVVENKKEL